jgi:hypothetical protein
MPVTSTPTIIDFVKDAGLLGLAVSPAQETLLRAIYGLPLTADQLSLWRECTGRATYPGQGFQEVTVLAGARAGKDSRIAVPIALFEALFGGHSKRLSRGERAVIPFVAQDHRATRIAFDYLRGYVEAPILQSEVVNITSQEIEFRNGVRVVTFPSTAASMRGWSIPAAILDEVGFWRLEGAADSDVEIQVSIRRGGLAFAETRIIKISTPYMRSGILFDDFSRHHGKDSPDLLVWRAPSVLMNPSLKLERLDRERRLDPQRFSREYEAEFQQDLSSAFDWSAIDACVVPGRRELSPSKETHYYGFVDPSGGGADAFTLAVAHSSGAGWRERATLDLVRWWTGGSPAEIVVEAAEILKKFDIGCVYGDRYSGAWVRDAFERQGVNYEVAARTKSEIYLECIAYVNSGRVELLDLPRLRQEIQNLERRPSSGGKDKVDHPPGGSFHDDVANAACGALWLVLEGAGEPVTVYT